MRKPQAQTTISEADLEKYGTDLLELDGWRSLKTDPCSDRSRGKGFGELGMADHLYIRYRDIHAVYMKGSDAEIDALAHVLWIEWKRKGGKAKQHQLNWIEAERGRGALVWLAGVDFPATPEGFFEHYKASGLCRREIR